MALHAGGKADLALLDAFMAAGFLGDGSWARWTPGRLMSAATQPRLAASQAMPTSRGANSGDYAQGLRVHDITAALTSDGTRLHPDAVARTGRNRVACSQRSCRPAGARHAHRHADERHPSTPHRQRSDERQPLRQHDLAGACQNQHAPLAGKMQVTGAEINLPENFPPQVAVLNVRRRGQPPPPPPPKESRIVLDLAVRTTGPVFVRGHGMDAEMAGTIQISGTAGAPIIAGGLRMERGSYTIVGQTLNFTTGRIRFDGTGLRSKLDPSLDFSAQTVSGGVTAVLAVTGYASAPKIALSSTPQLPQDGVVAHQAVPAKRQATDQRCSSPVSQQAAAAMGGIGGKLQSSLAPCGEPWDWIVSRWAASRAAPAAPRTRRPWKPAAMSRAMSMSA